MNSSFNSFLATIASSAGDVPANPVIFSILSGLTSTPEVASTSSTTPIFIPTDSKSSNDIVKSGSDPDKKTFPAVPVTSVHGNDSVLLYKIPNTELCYSFNFNNYNAIEKKNVYYCGGCKSKAVSERRKAKKESKDFNGDGYHLSIKASDGMFDTDPELLNHKCVPKVQTTVKTTRKIYKKLKGLRENPESLLKKPREHWNDVLGDPDLDLTEKLHLYSGGKRRLAISRALSSHRRKLETAETIPEEIQSTDTETLTNNN